MARVKVTTTNIDSKLVLWKNGTNLTDELVYLPGDGISENEIITFGWKNGVIIESVTDVSIFKKFLYKEKLS